MFLGKQNDGFFALCAITPKTYTAQTIVRQMAN